MKHIAMFGVVAILVIGSVVALSAAGFKIPFLQDYQQQRIINFILPDPNATFGAKYNVDQAKFAIGSGGLFGKGYGHGTQTQLRFLKVRHTDFIFSAVSEEFGLVGALFVVIVIVLVIWRCLRAAQKARDVAGMTIAYGVATLIFFQGHGQYWCEFEYRAGIGIAVAVHQLWRQWSHLPDAWDWIGGKCRHATQAVGFLVYH